MVSRLDFLFFVFVCKMLFKGVVEELIWLVVWWILLPFYLRLQSVCDHVIHLGQVMCFEIRRAMLGVAVIIYLDMSICMYVQHRPDDHHHSSGISSVQVYDWVI